MNKSFVIKFFRAFLFWMLFFAIHRLVFMVANIQYSNNTPFFQLLWTFVIGLRLDASFTGYIMVIIGLSQLPLLFLQRRVNFCWFSIVNKVFVVLLSAFLLGDVGLYSFWGKHMDVEAIGFLQTPDIVMASLQWYHPVVFIVALAVISYLLFKLFKLIIGKRNKTVDALTWKQTFVTAGVVVLVSAAMIAPIRGSVGVAPINTGVAYFSTHRYANHCAINPLWNLSYDMKKMDVTKKRYKYMDDEKANAIFDELTQHSGNYQSLLKTDKPNVVVILLESYASHIIEDLGGVNVTPNINQLISESVLFSNVRAAANRSDKGLVATLAGYQVLPSYSIIRFPEKTGSLPFLPKKLKEKGYNDLMYMYGGDIKFKNMNSFVKQAGFEKVVSIDEFESDKQGEKWGVHDEYTFRRLVKEMEISKEPYFKFLFTLSSHEPFDVPMERMFENDYYNSVAYTDKCIGEFFTSVKEQNLWDNSLFILIADHAVGGPKRIPLDDTNYANIPMIWTGGALSVKDTVITDFGSQTDLARTLLSQLNIDAKEFKFSKNILDQGVEKFAFNIIAPSGVSFKDSSSYQYYNSKVNRFIKAEGLESQTDSLKAKAYLQVIYNDHQSR
ncbi:LTA synthase family protein [Carboxylicivirga marina]|uniref:Sulfatase-like hydrolase/transferase n=1 Tax=Carboxylicivirga marina TaxID=2800988 RepID=A0ABS1HPN3_9BACT|nr:alkaline phosphatase family protein [Carboxylicivirga marina]MBK3519502.1 sulfatase-like hydrolase/transferase [Carboxylicivirga marina]